MTEINPASKTILVVDDEETVRSFFEILLSKKGFNVISVPSGTAALSRLRGKTFRRIDLVILDLMMPGPGGYEVIKELQKPEYQNVPILIATGRTMDKNTVAMIKLESNVHGYWQKPIDTDAFINKVSELLEVS